ncbi:helix-turn-helix transcriptional regulator [Sandarakinorhabdus oryzae]|uniref:helix-turn-helix transcriptional regulator n=1 Tax=Sandarakinorhabdus oryzae TaxID=2675220 RepID=UPI0012E12832|nr:AraC family transcriptional regulator [Sandarakinorhabdus oryzae]
MDSAEAGSPGRAFAQARTAIQLLGPLANAQTAPGSLAWFGHWLGWPAWLHGGSSHPPGRPLPDAITAADDLIITANIIDHGHADALLLRVAAGQALATGPITLMAHAHAPSLGHFARLLPQFTAVSSPYISLTLDEGEAEWAISLTSRFLAGPLLGFAGYLGALLCVRMLTVGVNERLDPVRIETTWRPGPGTDPAALAGPWQVSWDAGINRVRFPAHWADVANPGHDAGVWQLVQERLRAAAAAWRLQTDVARIRERVGGFLDREQRVPRFKQLAVSEAMSERSLSRLLANAGTSFQAIVDQERRLRAIRLINNPAMTQGDMAIALGFPDVSSFGRSFRRWFGMPPGEFRRSIAGNGLS